MYGFVIANSSPDFLSGEKTCSVELFYEKDVRNIVAYQRYSSVYEELKDDIDRDYTKKKLSKAQFIKLFNNDEAVCIQFEDYHINFEPFFKEAI